MCIAGETTTLLFAGISDARAWFCISAEQLVHSQSRLLRPTLGSYFLASAREGRLRDVELFVCTKHEVPRSRTT